ncbi:histone-lysine N-methyltransferase 2E-like isoform X3 [Centruroides sculpturatus]|uniref:histone-lysine N-methyltransferase 2E-like isoform X3 n=1 Tax=Centruroides sculpturatus TaxID=218467 RepID=UPI000C6D02A5|nr:histone-lysine N-methyltransferase 2E-like isoform X3 [Centruroides sculpturatus]
MTREERKIDAIMRAFERMEKTAKRRQQALERMAQQKAQQQKQEVEKDNSDALFIKSESNIGEEESSNLQSSGEAACNEEAKVALVTCQNNSVNNCRHKKGKRRRGSGTPARRRTRSNSGGSDIMSPDELPSSGINPVTITSAISPPNIVTSISTTTSTTITSNTVSNNSAFPKTKKFLMQEWLQEKAETSVPVSCPLTIHTELSWNLSTASPTCYVRCTRDSPNAGGISSAHLRRNSTSCMGQGGKSSSSLGSAKKRWLRQAMFESGTSEIECSNFETSVLDGGQNSPLHNGCFSPNPHSDASSPCVSPPGDIVTPLKKRRLMRESLESLPSPRSLSPNAPSGWPASLSSIESPDHSNSALEMSFPILSSEEKLVQIENVGEEDYDDTSTIQNNLNGLELHLVSAAKELREHWVTKNENSDMEPTSSSGLNQDINLNEEKIPSTNVGDIPSANVNMTDSSQDSSCLDLTCHDERESHVSSSESMIPVNRTEDDINDSQTLGNVSSSTICDSNEVTSTNKDLSPVEDNKDSLPDSSLSGDVELAGRINESDVCFVQQEQFSVESNCVQDCVTSSHIVNNITTTDKQDSSHIVNMSTPCLSAENAQNVQLPTTTSTVSTLSSLNNSNSVNVPHYTSVVSSSVSHKRKVSLSEYRLRMREQASTSTTETKYQKADNYSKNEDINGSQATTSIICSPPKGISQSKTESKSAKHKDNVNKEENHNGELDVRWNNNSSDEMLEQEGQPEICSAENSENNKDDNGCFTLCCPSSSSS